MTKRASDSQDLISHLYSNWTLRIGRFQLRSHSTIYQYPEQRYLFLFPFNRGIHLSRNAFVADLTINAKVISHSLGQVFHFL